MWGEWSPFDGLENCMKDELLGSDQVHSAGSKLTYVRIWRQISVKIIHIAVACKQSYCGQTTLTWVWKPPL